MGIGVVATATSVLYPVPPIKLLKVVEVDAPGYKIVGLPGAPLAKLSVVVIVAGDGCSG